MRSARSRSGFVYLLALLATLVVSSVAMVVSRGSCLSLRGELEATARSQCRAAALGVLRAVVNDLTTTLAAGHLPTLATVKPDGEQVGECTVVLLGRDPSGTRLSFGLIAEAGKLNVNDVYHDFSGTFAALPGMTVAVEAAIIDWRDSDDKPDENGGAERSDSAYAGAAVPYAPRNAFLQTVEELRLVRGVTEQNYFGEDVNGNGVLDAGEDTNGDGRLTRGLRDLLCLESREPETAPDGSARVSVRSPGLPALFSRLFGPERGKVINAKVPKPPANNRLALISALELSDDETATLWPYLIGPNQASDGAIEGRVGLIDAWSCHDEVLVALLGVDLAKTVVAARPATMPTGPAWLVKALGADGVKKYGHYLTHGSYQFRVDILAVRNDGAGWARLDAHIDCSAGVVRVVRIQPCESQGWPLPWANPDQLRQGQAIGDIPSFLSAGQH
jgi:hypothetical protein